MKLTRRASVWMVGGMIAGSLFLAAPGRAQLLTNSFSYTVNRIIPDNDLSGLTDKQTTTSEVLSIVSVRIMLQINGGFDGDYYAYLTHGSGFSVLLNRPGRTSGNDVGYGDGGLNVTLDDSASNGDIHLYELTLNPNGGALAGTWAPDGRNVNPGVSLDTTPRGALLNAFNGMNANGDWTLFLGDVSAVGEGTLAGWGLEVVGLVPEPSPWILLSLGTAVFVAARRQRVVRPL